MPPRSARRAPRRSPLRVAAAALLSLTFWGLVLLALAVVFVPLPHPTSARPTVVYDRRGRVLARLFHQNLSPVPLADVAPVMREAVVSTEDRTFWSNPGLSALSILRAAYTDLRAGHVVEGGSTITQQLAKNLYLTDSRTLSRKLKEAFLTLKLTLLYSKPQILSMYLNTIYFGEGAYGVEAAARTYFGVPARRLTLPQAAMLAGLIAAPSLYDPYVHPRAALARRAEVLWRMVQTGAVSPVQAARAAAAPLGLRRAAPRHRNLAPYFLDYVTGLLAAKDPSLARHLFDGGYRVYTTLDLRDQQAAELAFSQAMPPGQKNAVGVTEPQGALVALDPANGDILAMVGGRSYAETPFNRAVDARRQPGSAFKPVVYAALLSTPGYTAASVMNDSPVSFPAGHGKRYVPQNDSHRYLGPMLVREALALSDNVVAVKWAALLGVPTIVRMARRLGITSPLAPNLTLALGSSAVSPLEMARAYAALANGGYRITPRAVIRVTAPDGRTVFSQPVVRRRALSPQVAFILTDLLRSVFWPQGTAAGLANGMSFQVAGKTGTSNRFRDGWLVGYTTRQVCAVWVGYDGGSRSLPGYGAAMAGPVWAAYMRRVGVLHPPPPFPVPPDVVRVRVCTLDGRLPNPTCPTEWDYFVRGTQPTQVSRIRFDGATRGPWAVDASPWYFRTYGPAPANPVWNRLMGYTR